MGEALRVPGGFDDLGKRAERYEAFLVAGQVLLFYDGQRTDDVVSAMADLRRAAEPVRLRGSDPVVAAVVEVLAAAEQRVKWVDGVKAQEVGKAFEVSFDRVRALMRADIQG